MQNHCRVLQEGIKTGAVGRSCDKNVKWILIYNNDYQKINTNQICNCPSAGSKDFLVGPGSAKSSLHETNL